MMRKIDFQRVKIKLVVETYDTDQDSIADSPKAYISDSVVLMSNKNELQRFKEISERIHNINFSDEEKKKALDEFWKTTTLILLDSFIDGTEQVDEITGTPGFKFGKSTTES